MDNLNKDTTYDMFNEIKLLNEDLKEKDNVEVIFNVVLEKIIAKENIVKKLEPFKENIITLNNRYVRERISTNNSSFVNKWNTILHSSINDLENNLNKQINYDYEIFTLEQKYDKFVEWHNQLTEFRTWTLNEGVSNELYRDIFDWDWRMGEWNKSNFEYLINKQSNQPNNYNEQNAQKMLDRLFETYSIYFSPMNILFVKESERGYFNQFDLTKNVIENIKDTYHYLKEFIKTTNNKGTTITDWFYTYFPVDVSIPITNNWKNKDNINKTYEYMSQLNFRLTMTNVRHNVTTLIFDEDSELISNWLHLFDLRFDLLSYQGISFGNSWESYSLNVPYDVKSWSFHTIYKLYKLISIFNSELIEESDLQFVRFIKKYYDKIQKYIADNNMSFETLYSKKDELLSNYFDEINSEDISNIRPNIAKIMDKWFSKTKVNNIVSDQVLKILRLKNRVSKLEHYDTFLNILKPLNDLIFTFWDKTHLENTMFETNIGIFHNNINQQLDVFLKTIDSLDDNLKNEFLSLFRPKKLLNDSDMFTTFLSAQPLDMRIVKLWFNQVYFSNNFYYNFPHQIKEQGTYLNYDSKQENLKEIFFKESLTFSRDLRSHHQLITWLLYPNTIESSNINFDDVTFSQNLSSQFYKSIKRNQYETSYKNKITLMGMVNENLANEIFETMSDPTFINDSQRFEELIKKILEDLNTNLTNGFYKLLEYDINQGLFFEKYKTMSDDQKQNDHFYNKTMDMFNNWTSKSEQEIKNFFIEYLQNFQ